jgi:hypothetical protein
MEKARKVKATTKKGSQGDATEKSDRSQDAIPRSKAGRKGRPRSGKNQQNKSGVEEPTLVERLDAVVRQYGGAMENQPLRERVSKAEADVHGREDDADRTLIDRIERLEKAVGVGCEQQPKRATKTADASTTKPIDAPQLVQFTPNREMLQMVEDAVRKCSSKDPVRVGNFFKTLFEFSFADRRKALKLSKTHALSSYIELISDPARNTIDRKMGSVGAALVEDAALVGSSSSAAELPAPPPLQVSIKKKKTKNKKGPSTAATNTLDARWTSEASLPSDLSKKIADLVQIEDASEQLNVQEKPWKALNQHSSIQGLIHKYKIPRNVQTALAREAMRATSHQNREKIYADKSLRDRLRIEIGEKMIASNESEHAEILKKHACERNIATTHLGLVLVGRDHMDAAVDLDKATDDSVELDNAKQDRKNLLQDVSDGDLNDHEGRVKIITATLKCSERDEVARYLCVSRGSGSHDVDFQKTISSRAEKGETQLEKDLKGAGMKFKTEEENVVEEFNNQEEGRRATPDVLFDREHTILGRPVTWIDSKNWLAIPQVTTQKIESLQRQTQKYVERFGPGAIFWTHPGGFCEGIKDLLNEKVGHFRSNSPKFEADKGKDKKKIPAGFSGKGKGKGSGGASRSTNDQGFFIERPEVAQRRHYEAQYEEHVWKSSVSNQFPSTNNLNSGQMHPHLYHMMPMNLPTHKRGVPGCNPEGAKNRVGGCRIDDNEVKQQRANRLEQLSSSSGVDSICGPSATPPIIYPLAASL